MVTLPNTGFYSDKDQLKANMANKFIGRGSLRSSTNAYAAAYKENANCGSYLPTDVVFISAEGNRLGRLKPDLAEIKLAASAKVSFVTDNHANRERPYNCGEREVANELLSLGYKDTNGVWDWCPQTS